MLSLSVKSSFNLMARKLYVGNLDWGVNEEELAEIFRPIGNVITSMIILDRDTGKSRGFGFVEMEDDEMTGRAMEELDGSTHKNRKLVVKEAKPESRDGSPVSRILAIVKEFINKGEVGQEKEVNSRGKSFTIRRNANTEEGADLGTEKPIDYR